MVVLQKNVLQRCQRYLSSTDSVTRSALTRYWEVLTNQFCWHFARWFSSSPLLIYLPCMNTICGEIVAARRQNADRDVDQVGSRPFSCLSFTNWAPSWREIVLNMKRFH